MKKKYEKPQMYKESFEISEFIAGSCSVDVGFGDTGAASLCSYPDPDTGGAFQLFNNPNTAGSPCTTEWVSGNSDKGCYHIPQDGVGYFGS